MTMGLWDGLDEAEIWEQGNYVDVGFLGVVLMKKTLAKNTERKGLAFIVEMDVVETNWPDKYPVGASVTWFQKMQDKNVAFPAIMKWAAACFGYHPNQKMEIERDVAPNIVAAMNHATAYPDDNMFTGKYARLEVVPHTTRAGIDIGLYKFSPYGS